MRIYGFAQNAPLWRKGNRPHTNALERRARLDTTHGEYDAPIYTLFSTGVGAHVSSKQSTNLAGKNNVGLMKILSIVNCNMKDW